MKRGRRGNKGLNINNKRNRERKGKKREKANKPRTTKQCNKRKRRKQKQSRRRQEIDRSKSFPSLFVWKAVWLRKVLNISSLPQLLVTLISLQSNFSAVLFRLCFHFLIHSVHELQKALVSFESFASSSDIKKKSFSRSLSLSLALSAVFQILFLPVVHFRVVLPSTSLPVLLLRQRASLLNSTLCLLLLPSLFPPSFLSLNMEQLGVNSTNPKNLHPPSCLCSSRMLQAAVDREFFKFSHWSGCSFCGTSAFSHRRILLLLIFIIISSLFFTFCPNLPLLLCHRSNLASLHLLFFFQNRNAPCNRMNRQFNHNPNYMEVMKRREPNQMVQRRSWQQPLQRGSPKSKKQEEENLNGVSNWNRNWTSFSSKKRQKQFRKKTSKHNRTTSSINHRTSSNSNNLIFVFPQRVSLLLLPLCYLPLHHSPLLLHLFPLRRSLVCPLYFCSLPPFFSSKSNKWNSHHHYFHHSLLLPHHSRKFKNNRSNPVMCLNVLFTSWLVSHHPPHHSLPLFLDLSLLLLSQFVLFISCSSSEIILLLSNPLLHRSRRRHHHHLLHLWLVLPPWLLFLSPCLHPVHHPLLCHLTLLLCHLTLLLCHLTMLLLLQLLFLLLSPWFPPLPRLQLLLPRLSLLSLIIIPHHSLPPLRVLLPSLPALFQCLLTIPYLPSLFHLSLPSLANRLLPPLLPLFHILILLLLHRP